MTYPLYNIERSFCEFVRDNLSTQSGEVVRYEFPVSELGSHTYSVEVISDDPEICAMGNSITSGSKGRNIRTLAEIDVFRMPTTDGQPDVGGAKKMLSGVQKMFGTRHYIPCYDYGSSPTGSTVGTRGSFDIAVRLDGGAKRAFDPDPLVRRHAQLVTLNTKEVY